MRQVLLSLLALGLVACGGDESSDDPALTAEQAQTAADRVMLTPDDLGSGWTETGTAPPSEDEGTDIDACLSEEVAAASDDPLGESDTHEFARGDEPTSQQQLQISTVVVEDPAHASGLVDELASESVRSCLTETFQSEVAADAETDGVEVTLGSFSATEDFAGAGEGATRLTSPVELSAEGVTIPATVDLVVVHTGQVATALVAFALGEPIPDEDLTAWAEAVGELQAGAVGG